MTFHVILDMTPDMPQSAGRAVFVYITIFINIEKSRNGRTNEEIFETHDDNYDDDNDVGDDTLKELLQL